MQLGCITVIPSCCKNLENGGAVVSLIDFVCSIKFEISGQFNSNFSHAIISIAIFLPYKMSNRHCELHLIPVKVIAGQISFILSK